MKIKPVFYLTDLILPRSKLLEEEPKIVTPAVDENEGN